MKKIVGILLTAVGIVSAALSLISQISVSVIGGPDGPTAVSFAGRTGALAVVGMIAGLVMSAVGIFLIAGKNKSRFNLKK